jgi:Sulfotransferase domain
VRNTLARRTAARSNSISGQRHGLPNLIVIGAQKCGTTSLHYYLDLHPEIAMARAKELDFFVTRGSWAKGLDWYTRQFDPAAPVRGESSPSYTNYPRDNGVAERLHATVPDAKLIFLVRDPVERIISQYVHEYTKGNENRPIEETLADDLLADRYINRSKYFLQLEQYLRFFEPSRIEVVAQAELLLERPATMRRIFEFLEVDPSFSHPNFAALKHRTRDRRRNTWAGEAVTFMARNATRPFYRPSRQIAWKAERLLVFPFARKVERPGLTEHLREELIRELRDDANLLRQLTGQKFRDWCV